MIKQISIPRGQELAVLCKNLIADRDDSALLKRLRGLTGNDNVRLARTGDEWFRVGGIVDIEGKRVSHDLIEWVERTYLECGQNLQVMIDHILEHRLIATRIVGRTLYYVEPIDTGAADFVLIEIEKMQEQSYRMLVSEDNLPEDVEDIVDPFTPEYLEPYNLGPASYQYRRKTDVAIFMQTLAEHHVEIHPVQRFIDDWNKSSASKNEFTQDWLIRPHQHVGRYGEQVINAELINLRTEPLTQMDDLVGKSGITLSTILKRFDRKAGYSFAWYFYMIKGLLVSPHSAEAVYNDITGDFAYLPESDETVLKAWMADPYYIN